jgi:hypothetical protein
MSSEYKQRVEDRESWLASVADGEGGPAERTHLLSAAALLHGVVEGIQVPEGAEERSHRLVMAKWEEASRPQEAPSARPSRSSGPPTSGPPSPAWTNRLGGLLRVVFTLGRRR